MFRLSSGLTGISRVGEEDQRKRCSENPSQRKWVNRQLKTETPHVHSVSQLVSHLKFIEHLLSAGHCAIGAGKLMMNGACVSSRSSQRKGGRETPPQLATVQNTQVSTQASGDSRREQCISVGVGGGHCGKLHSEDGTRTGLWGVWKLWSFVEALVLSTHIKCLPHHLRARPINLEGETSEGSQEL